MERRVGLRARTDFRVIARIGCLASHCRGIEISSTGIIVDRGRPVTRREEPLLLKLELQLPERMKALRAIARPVWSFGSQQALRFVLEKFSPPPLPWHAVYPSARNLSTKVRALIELLEERFAGRA